MLYFKQQVELLPIGSFAAPEISEIPLLTAHILICAVFYWLVFIKQAMFIKEIRVEIHPSFLF